MDPTLIGMVTGTTRLGVLGVLLAVAFPIRICAVPVASTFLNGRSKVRVAAVPTVFEI